MASEYLMKKAREAYQPQEERVLTPEEKRRNWWYYHKYHVAIGVVGALCLINLIWTALGIGKTKPDFSVAYVGSTALSPETQEALKQGFEAIASDLNGDGKICVELAVYASPETGDSDTLYYAQAAQVQLVADVTDCRSYFFIMEYPDRFQNATNVLRNIDGSLPAYDDGSADGKYMMWSDCSQLAGMELPQDLSGMAFGRRGFWTSKRSANEAGCDALWETLTEGVREP